MSPLHIAEMPSRI